MNAVVAVETLNRLERVLLRRSCEVPLLFAHATAFALAAS